MSMLEHVILGSTFLVCLSIIWTSLRVGITPVPSSQKARQAILAAAEKAPEGTIVELGSGWGQLAIALANKYPDRQVVGYEVSLIPWLVSLLRKRLHAADNLELKRHNFLTCPLPPAALLVCYLYPGGMAKLADKLGQEQSAETLLISNTFALPGQEPEQIIRLADLYKSPIYVYRFDKQVGSNIEK